MTQNPVLHCQRLTRCQPANCLTTKLRVDTQVLREILRDLYIVVDERHHYSCLQGCFPLMMSVDLNYLLFGK